MQQRLSVWVGAGLVTAGVSAALVAGAGIAGADPGAESGGSTADSSSTEGPKGTDEPDSPSGKKDPVKKDPVKKDRVKKVPVGGKEGDEAKPTVDKSKPPHGQDDPKPKAEESKADEPKETEDPKEPEEAQESQDPETVDEGPGPQQQPEQPAKRKAPVASKPTAEVEPDVAAAEPLAEAAVEPSAVPKPSAVPEPDTKLAAAESTPEAAQPQLLRVTADRAPQPEPVNLVASVLGFVTSVIGAVVVNVGSLALTALQAVEALVTGPPALPANSTVTVRSSWITLSTGQRVAADWYYPEVPEGDPPPDRMILLNHGLLALGPMYSYTAATLAENTGAIVVAPSLTSNFFLGDDYWLGGTGMAEHIAELFEGDRTALTQSALDAGYAEAYGLGADAALPRQFGLVGHSLGGNLVVAAAGFLAETDAADDLVGVVTLDGVPFGTTVADALGKLDTYEENGGHYIPIREIGAPWNIYNSVSNIKEALNEGRPGRFNGVVLTGGQHSDSMRGGNPLIQFAMYVAAGFPQPQNPPAVDALTAEWLNDWFDGDTDNGDLLGPGSTVYVDTPQGQAEGTVIAAAAVTSAVAV